MVRKLLLPLLLFQAFTCFAQNTTLIPWGAPWKYLDDGSNQGTQWTQLSFNDAPWASGMAELGYGDGDEATTVSYGPSSSNKYTTTYFRNTFNVTNPSQYTNLQLNMIRDDGIIVYLNGTEIYRSNMPGGNVNYLTQASSAISWPNEDDVHSGAASPALLVQGNNVIAVEIHQDNGGSSDISFNFELIGSAAALNATITRGPYLQIATPTSMIVRWRTDIPTDGKVLYGPVSSQLNQSATSAAWTTEHEVQISGLNPSSLYYYSIGSFSSQFTPSANQHFKTNPLPGTPGHYRFWAIGDAGTATQNQTAVRDAFYLYNGSAAVDGWLMLGDNAYDNGYDSQYQSSFFNIYQPTLESSPVWPAPGNHDYNNHIPFSPPPAYYDNFSLPANGESGGLPSGTEKYYSYDYGNIHFIVLDSYDEGRASNDPMANWLQADLAATTQQWIIAYWHHPPYTKGSHDSDDPFLNGELIDMRTNILPILENGGVDLVLNGHSHCYERSFLIDGHYGYSNTLNNSMILDGTSGAYPNSCPYEKNTIFSQSHKGTVYAVVGCSGKLSSVSSGWPHPAMYSSDANDFGSLVIDIEANRLDASFLTSNNTIYDHFSIIKNAGVHQSLTFCQGDTLVLRPSWPGSHIWFPGNITADSLVINPMVPTVYFVHDSSGCLQDTFSIVPQISPPCPPFTSVQTINLKPEFRIAPQPVQHNEPFTILLSLPYSSSCTIRMMDVSGRIIYEKPTEAGAGESVFAIDPGSCLPGIYFIELNAGAWTAVQKLIVY